MPVLGRRQRVLAASSHDQLVVAPVVRPRALILDPPQPPARRGKITAGMAARVTLATLPVLPPRALILDPPRSLAARGRIVARRTSSAPIVPVPLPRSLVLDPVRPAPRRGQLTMRVAGRITPLLQAPRPRALLVDMPPQAQRRGGVRWGRGRIGPIIPDPTLRNALVAPLASTGAWLAPLAQSGALFAPLAESGVRVAQVQAAPALLVAMAGDGRNSVTLAPSGLTISL